MRVLFYGSYKRDFPRYRVFYTGLKKNGVEVTECRETGNFFLRSLKLIFRAFIKKFDVIYSGYPSHADVFSAKIISIIRGKPIVFDPFVSEFESYRDYGMAEDGTLKAKFLKFLDWSPCKLADRIIFYSEEEAEFFMGNFSADRKKIDVVPVGEDENIFFPVSSTENEKVIVYYIGRTTPLHGLEHIAKAAEILKNNKKIKFIFRGDNRFYFQVKEKYSNLPNVEFRDNLQDYDHLKDLVEEFRNADICFGLFGGTEKAGRAIPNKVFDAMAVRKPVISRRYKIMEKNFRDGEDIILIDEPIDKNLASAIEKLAGDKKLRERIAGGGYETFKKNFSSDVIGRQLKEVLEKAITQ